MVSTQKAAATPNTVHAEAGAIAGQSNFPWNSLPEGVQAEVINRMPAARAAALAMTSRHNQQMVEQQSHLRAWLTGAAQGPLPRRPHALLHRTVAPNGGIETAGRLLAAMQARGEAPDDRTLGCLDALFVASWQFWLRQQRSAGTSEADLRRIEGRVGNVRSGTSNALDLTALSCTVLPPLGRASWLARLDLSFSRIARLPERIAAQTALTELYLNECTGLQTLPACLADLTALARLDLTGCAQLVALPKRVGDLVALRWLSLQGCRALVALPESLVELSALTTLSLVGCARLTALPAKIGGLTALQALSLAECTGLTALPPSLGALRELAQLDLGGCTNLLALPESIGNLGMLTMLELHGCGSLTTLPESIGRLTQLEFLDLSVCTNLASLPSTITHFSALRWLGLFECSSLWRLPRSIYWLPRLEVLGIDPPTLSSRFSALMGSHAPPLICSGLVLLSLYQQRMVPALQEQELL